jgi:lysylphosphatidylglycerol synthetase-like protein (DUF2156 family)
MAICPHCRQNAIGVHAKSWSSASHPAKCRGCGGLSFIANTHGTAAGRVVVVVPCIAIMGAIFTGALWPLAAGAALVVVLLAYDARAFYLQPMLATAEAAVGGARRWERLGVAIILLIGVVGVIAYGASHAV